MRQGGMSSNRESSFVIRRANADDLPACANIINAYIDATDWLPRTASRSDIAAMFVPSLLETRSVFVADMRGRIGGYLSLNRSDRFLPAIYVDPAFRGTGMGKALLDAAKAECPAGFDLTVFEPNADAVRFYVREGLVEVPGGRDDKTEEGVPTLRMRWAGTTAGDS